MVFRNVVYVLFLVASSINVSEVSAAPNKSSQGQYQVSSKQVYKFLQKNSFDFAGHWALFKEGNIELDSLQDMIDRVFKDAARYVNLGDGATVLTLLTQCFGACEQEPKWLKQAVSKSLNYGNDQRKKSAQADKKPFTKWQGNSSWAPCTQNRSVQLIFQLISKAISVFLDEVKVSKNVPEFYCVVRNLRAGNTEQLLVELVVVPDYLQVSVQERELKELADQDMQEDEISDEYNQCNQWDLKSDLWAAVSEHVGYKTQVFMLATGITCVGIGILENLYL